MFTVARNLTLSYRRWNLLDRGRLQTARLHAGQDQAASPLDLATAAQTGRQLEAALLALPDKYREVLLLVAVDGMAHDVAARVVNLRPDAFRQRLSRRAEHDRRDS